MDTDPDFGRMPKPNPDRNYAMSGRIMLTAIVVLFAVIVFMVVLHIYARWYLLRARRRHLTRRSRRRTHLIFYVEPNALSAANRGLEPHIIKSLPVVSYTNLTDPTSLECAVCLSEFEENEKVRLLPKCNHSFHIECIDMWFHSHSTCPLCRSPVDPFPFPETKSDHVSVSIDEPAIPEMGSSSVVCRNCHDHPAPSSSSVGDRRKAFEMGRVTIDVPQRAVGGGELGTSSPASSHSLRSPASRLLSLRRILSMNRKAAVSPSAGCGTSFASAVSELEDDLECGKDESTQQKSHIDTPRPR